jgi:hypothetical protein
MIWDDVDGPDGCRIRMSRVADVGRPVIFVGMSAC